MSRESCVSSESIPALGVVGHDTDFHQLEGEGRGEDAEEQVEGGLRKCLTCGSQDSVGEHPLLEQINLGLSSAEGCEEDLTVPKCPGQAVSSPAGAELPFQILPSPAKEGGLQPGHVPSLWRDFHSLSCAEYAGLNPLASTCRFFSWPVASVPPRYVFPSASLVGHLSVPANWDR